LAAGTIFTAMAHKLATVDATRDITSKTLSMPNFNKDGLTKTFRSLANGNVYTDPAFAPYYKNPANVVQKVVNVLNSGCGPNMFLFRFTLLLAFREIFKFVQPRTESGLNKLGLFTKPEMNNTVTAEPTSGANKRI
jgi:hypothetical protein